MANNGMEWDESRGGNRTPLNLISFPEHGEWHRATHLAFRWAWRPSDAHDGGRVLLPGVLVERLFRFAPVPDPTVLSSDRVMTKCLNVDT